MMSSNSIPRPSPLSELVPRTVQLHYLIAAGKCDSDEADAVRDEMDTPWLRATEREREIASGLSEDLNGLTMGRRSPVGSREENLGRFRYAFESESWYAAIDAIRDEEPRLPPGLANLLRGICWSYASFPEAGEVFLSALARVEAPADWRIPLWRIANFLHARRISEAATAGQEAVELTEDRDTLRMALVAIAARADELTGDEHINLHRQAIAIGESLLAGEAIGVPDNEQRSQIVSVLISLALSYIAINQMDRAVDLCNRAVSLDPDNTYGHLLHAWLTREQSPQNANSEFGRSLRASFQAKVGLPNMPVVFPEAILNS